MKNLIIFVVFALLAASISFNISSSYEPIRYYSRAGENKGFKKVFMDTMIVNATGSAFSVDISAAGFSHVFAAVASPMRNTSTINQMAVCNLKTVSTTSAVFNVIQPDFSALTVLGIGVLGGDGFVFATANTVTLQVFVFGD